jgi:outer membrane protein TolC
MLGAIASGAEQPSRAAPILSLDAAIAGARQQNRVLQARRLEVAKTTQQLASVRSLRRPVFNVKMTTGSLVAPLDFRFGAGSFGVFPSTGPIPFEDTTVTTKPHLSTFLLASVVQPLTQLRRIGRGERAAALARDVAAEQGRAVEAEITSTVKRLYYGIVQAEAGLRARLESVRLHRELVRVMDHYAAERVVLSAEALSIRAGLMQQEHDVAVARNTARGFREQLNTLLARDLDEPFEIEALQPTPVAGDDLPVDEERAIADRPEARISRLQSQQAAMDLEATERPGVPDLSLSFNYAGFYGFQVLPRHGAHVGVLASWEPWDWGRKGAEREGKRLVYEQSSLAAREAEAQMRLDVRARHRALREAFDLIDVREAARNAARERLRVSTERFARDAALERELLEAQARLAQSDFDYQQAVAGYWMARADFERARGDQ